MTDLLSDTPTMAEIVAAVKALQARTIGVKDLPLKQLQDKLELGWQPDGSILLQDHSVTKAKLTAGLIPTPYAFSALSAGVALPNAAFVVVPFMTEEYDVGLGYDAPNSRFIAPVAGVYAFQTHVAYSSAAAAGHEFALELYKNAATSFGVSDAWVTTGASLGPSASGARALVLAAGDTVQVRAYVGNNNGGAAAVGASTYFQGSLITTT